MYEVSAEGTKPIINGVLTPLYAVIQMVTKTHKWNSFTWHVS